MAAETKLKSDLTPAARIGWAAARIIEPLESRVLFAAGDLDLTFAGTGTATLDFFSRNDFGRAVAVQSDDKVLVAGWSATGISSRGNDVAVARFNVDGTLDTTFGVGGKVTTHLGSTTDTAYALSVQSDGRIVVAGTTRGTGTGNDFAVVRYNADGSLDATFGTGGITRSDLGGLATDQLLDMTLTGDGRIVVVGSTIIGGNQQFAVARYTAAGLLDATFDGDGIVVHTVVNGAALAKAVAMLADGSMILAGSVTNFSTFASNFAAVRLLADGALDTNFGTGGWATVVMGGEAESAGAVVVQDGGQIVLVGQRSAGDGQDIALARLTADGQLDESFGGNGTGYVVTDFAGGVDWAAGALLQPDGKIVVAGQGTVNGPYRLAVARYNADGILDTSFGGGGSGIVMHSFDAAGESFGEGGVAIDSQGRLVVGGQIARGGLFDMAVARLQNTVVLKIAPSADAGGAYVVNAGGVLVLDGSGSSDVDGSIVSYEWDFDYNGSSFDVDANGVAPAFSAEGLTGPATRTVALRVTDDAGATGVIATTTVTINAAPTALPGGAYTVTAGQSVQLDGGSSMDVDGSIVAYEWDFNYDGSTFDVDASGATVTFAAPADGAGTTRTIALRCIDDHGAASVTTTTVTIHPAQDPGTAVLVDDPAAPGRKMLSVLGTAADDTIRFKQNKKGNVEVRLGNKRMGSFSGMTRIVIDGGAGNDIIDAGNVTIPVVILGGAGDDLIAAGDGNNVLLGGAGNDKMSGGRGNDLMGGGAGRDAMFSDFDNDLVLAGSLSFEHDLPSTTAVLAEWTRTDRTLSQRVSNLMNGGGKNGSTKL